MTIFFFFFGDNGLAIIRDYLYACVAYFAVVVKFNEIRE
jgi:hypothetical protein